MREDGGVGVVPYTASSLQCNTNGTRRLLTYALIPFALLQLNSSFAKLSRAACSWAVLSRQSTPFSFLPQ